MALLTGLSACSTAAPPAAHRAPPPPVVILPESLLTCPAPAGLGEATTVADGIEKYLDARLAERICRENLEAIRRLYLKQKGSFR